MAIVIFANFMAYYLVLYSLYTYDIFDYIKTNFYETKKFDKFKFHPYGEFVNECRKNENKSVALFNYMGMNVQKRFWVKNMDLLIKLSDSRMDKSFSEFNDINSKINSLKIDEFTFINPANQKQVIPWDIENEEQINYFLFEMANYTALYFGGKKFTLIY